MPGSSTTENRCCILCGKELAGSDRDRSTCYDCRSPKGKVVDLDVAIRAEADSPERIPEWRKIRHLLRGRFGEDRSDIDLWERAIDWLQAECNLEPNEYLPLPLSWLMDVLRGGLSAQENQDSAVSGPTSQRTVPHAFVVSNGKLHHVCWAELERIGDRWPAKFVPDVAKAARRYVDELSRIDGARSELTRRALLLQKSTAEGSEFFNAWSELRPNVLRWRDRLARYFPGVDRTALKKRLQDTWDELVRAEATNDTMNVGQCREELEQLNEWELESRMRVVPARVSEVAAFEGRPYDMDALEEFRKSLDVLLKQDRHIFGDELRRMEGAAWAVFSEADRYESEGCTALLLWGSDLSGVDSDSELRAFLESRIDPETERLTSQWNPKETLDSMLAAADAMMSWLHERNAMAASERTDRADSSRRKRTHRQRGKKEDKTRAIDQAVQYLHDNPDIAETITNKELAEKIVQCSPSVLSTDEAKRRITEAKARARGAMGSTRRGHCDAGQQADAEYEENWTQIDQTIDGHG